MILYNYKPSTQKHMQIIKYSREELRKHWLIALAMPVVAILAGFGPVAIRLAFG